MIATIKIPRATSCLIVEDAEERIKWFRKVLPGCTVAVNPKEALAILQSTDNDFDIVFLDHDCRVDTEGTRWMVEPTDPDFLNSTFWRVAQHLHRMEYSGQVVIHSGNPIGAKRMEALLGSVCKVAVIPFGRFDIQVLA